MSGACRSCAAPVQWATTIKGKAMPLDLDPVEDPTARGVFVVYEDAVDRAQARTFEQARTAIAEQLAVSEQQAEKLIRGTYGAYTSHFATCPNAGGHRGKGHR